MGRQARQASKAVRQSTRAMQRLLRRARSLTAGEFTVVRHLLQPVEVGPRVSDPHLIVSDNLERIHAILIM